MKRNRTIREFINQNKLLKKFYPIQYKRFQSDPTSLSNNIAKVSINNIKISKIFVRSTREQSGSFGELFYKNSQEELLFVIQQLQKRKQQIKASNLPNQSDWFQKTIELTFKIVFLQSELQKFQHVIEDLESCKRHQEAQAQRRRSYIKALHQKQTKSSLNPQAVDKLDQKQQQPEKQGNKIPTATFLSPQLHKNEQKPSFIFVLCFLLFFIIHCVKLRCKTQPNTRQQQLNGAEIELKFNAQKQHQKPSKMKLEEEN